SLILLLTPCVRVCAQSREVFVETREENRSAVRLDSLVQCRLHGNAARRGDFLKAFMCCFAHSNHAHNGYSPYLQYIIMSTKSLALRGVWLLASHRMLGTGAPLRIPGIVPGYLA